MGWVSGLMRLVPGMRHIAAGRCAAGAVWFSAFVLALNFGLLAPVAWPGEGARAVRTALCGAALLLGLGSHRLASRLERRNPARKKPCP